MKATKILALILNISLLLSISTAGEDHSEFIDQVFNTPQEVTAVCLECHEDAAKEVMSTVHWTWNTDSRLISGSDSASGQGKINVFNNFCIAVESNWPRCTSCHAGYGWKDSSFDFNKEENVDCLVCHDQTGQYKKSPAGAGLPDKKVDLTAVARSVANPGRQNCGVCHFYGGGGENVKHGDLDEGLVNPDENYDVHMGRGMSCQDCHETDSHNIKGESMAILTGTSNRVDCVDCHEMPIHEKDRLNKHAEKIACQTCHIPEYAKDRPTKTYWDWSMAGRNIVGKKDEYGMDTYNKKKGTFAWGQKLIPEYQWYNGKSTQYLKGDTLNPREILALNRPLGKVNQQGSQIYPFKIMRGKQIFDSNNNYLIIPQLWKGYWTHFDWNKAAADGMKVAGLEYSGEYDFVETEMYWKLNHMVSPADKSLKCKDCHGKGEGKRIDWQKLGYRGDQQSKKFRD